MSRRRVWSAVSDMVEMSRRMTDGNYPSKFTAWMLLGNLAKGSLRRVLGALSEWLPGTDSEQNDHFDRMIEPSCYFSSPSEALLKIIKGTKG